MKHLLTYQRIVFVQGMDCRIVRFARRSLAIPFTILTAFSANTLLGISFCDDEVPVLMCCANQYTIGCAEDYSVTFLEQLSVDASNTTFIIQNGAQVETTGFRSAESKGVTGVVTRIRDQGTVVTSTGPVRIGNSGQSTLYVQDSAILNASSLMLGYDASQTNNDGSNNRMYVHTGASVNISGRVDVGYQASNCSVEVTGGSQIISGGVHISTKDNWYSWACCNAITVSGENSLWEMAGAFYAGDEGSNASVTISEGGTIYSKSSIIGNRGRKGDYHSVSVRDPNSQWIVDGTLYVGLLGSSSTVTVAAGAYVKSNNCTIGDSDDFYDQESTGNLLIVKDPGSIFQVDGTFRIGRLGIGNIALVQDRAIVIVNGSLGGATANGNRLRINNGFLAWKGDQTNSIPWPLLQVHTGQSWISASEDTPYFSANYYSDDASAKQATALGGSEGYDGLGGYTILIGGTYAVTDADDDGLLDAWEQQIIDADPNDTIENIEDVLPEDDFDQDGLSNATEFEIGTDPTDSDSDDDFFSDGFEHAQGLNPLDNGELILSHHVIQFLKDNPSKQSEADLYSPEDLEFAFAKPRIILEANNQTVTVHMSLLESTDLENWETVGEGFQIMENVDENTFYKLLIIEE